MCTFMLVDGQKVAVMLQLPGNAMLALAEAMSASLSCQLSVCLQHASDSAECAAALRSAAIAAGGIEAEILATRLTVRKDRDGGDCTIVLGTENWLANLPAVPRMLHCICSSGASTTANAASNLRALAVLAQLPIEGVHLTLTLSPIPSMLHDLFMAQIGSS